MQILSKILLQILLLIIRGYQLFISPLFGPRCRFYPSCSHYAFDALKQFGVLEGSWVALKRIIKCQPFHPGGFDPLSDLHRH